MAVINVYFIFYFFLLDGFVDAGISQQ